MKTFQEVRSGRGYWDISLSKLIDFEVVDIEGHITKDLKSQEISFIATHIVLKNGLRLELSSHWTEYDIHVIEDDSNEYFRRKEAGLPHTSQTILGLWDNHHNELRAILDTMPGWGKGDA